MVHSLYATAALLRIRSKTNPLPLPTYHTSDGLLNLNKPLPRTPEEIDRKRPVPIEGKHAPNDPLEPLSNSGLWATMRHEGDGVWQCHRCHHQNRLNHARGSHPFGQLKCRCKHVWCFDCTTSDILRPLYTEVTDPVLLSKLEKKADGRICRRCGLTWKGYRTYCSCGGDRWRGFLVGSSKDYREGNPDAVFARALERKLGISLDIPR
jgi:hypothetical protein